MKSVRIRVAGRVQGVGFRLWLQEEALALGLSGWVRNRHEGSVEALISGDPLIVDRLVALSRVGPPGAAVSDVEVLAAAGSVPAGFAIWPSV